jgi:hypothetical protein
MSYHSDEKLKEAEEEFNKEEKDRADILHNPDDDLEIQDIKSCTLTS